MESSRSSTQVQSAVSVLCELFSEALLGIYLHGSAVQGQLRPQSDIDLLAIIGRPMDEGERVALVTELLAISGRHPRHPSQPRCLEVMVFDANGPGMHLDPARAELVYGEWLRAALKNGEINGPTSDPEHTLILAQARENAVSLIGPQAPELIPKVPFSAVRSAMRDSLPALSAGLLGDERNVLLTLARIWRTAEHGDFVSKDAAAAWAIPKLAGKDALILDYARKAYLGEIVDTWADKRTTVQSAANQMRRRLSLLL
jgi:predicted nucleotidyltransferase